MKTETKLTKNDFVKGRNSDVDPSLINPDQYVSAFNVELVSEGGAFFALTNVNGTTFKTILSDLPDDCEVLNWFRNRYLIDGQYYHCLTIFTAADSLFKIWCYDTENDDLYQLYEEPYSSDYITEDRVVDGVTYPENGVDILYFTDNYHEVRYLKCEIPDDYTPNFLSSYEISLLRKGANGTIVLDSIDATGGSLLSGTYQFAYRMCDPVNKRFTRWSSLTNPVHIYSRDNGDDQVYAGIGLSTTRKIILDITPGEIELDNFDYIQLAVVENVGVAPPTTADLIDIVLANAVSGVVTLEYKANTSIGSIPIEDITVDLAQVERVKTLNVKQNRLYAGNIHYTELAFDAGIAVPPDPPVIPALADWIDKPSGQTWTLSSTPDTSVNGSGGVSDYVCGAVATVGGSSYSFSITWEVFVTGSSTPTTEIKIAILDASFNELDSAIVNYSTAGVKVTTVRLTPPSAGTYLGFHITNNTPFDTKTYELQDAVYNTPSAATSGPSVTTGSFITSGETSADLYASDEAASRYIGYFRDEVYRFGVVYTDENGNKSTVSPLDLDGVITDNQITSGLSDVKFPNRATDPSYSILDGSSTPRALGLRFEGMQGHPSWACSMEVVRLPRKKNILFQTPVVPMYKLNGSGAVGQYPSEYIVAAGSGTTHVPVDSAQPMTAGYTYVPKNLFWPELRSTEKLNNSSGSGTTAKQRNEIKLVRESQYDYAVIFPPQSMYGEIGSQLDPFVFTGGETLDTVDYALLRGHIEVFSSAPVTSPTSVAGDYVDTSILGSFSANGDHQYFFDSATGGKSIAAQFRNIAIGDYEFFDNGNTAGTVAGASVYDYAAFQTQGVPFGTQPSVPRSAVIRLQNKINDLNSLNIAFRDGQLNAVSPGGFIFASSGPVYDTQVENDYVNTYGSFTNNNAGSGSNISALPIANVTLGFGDDRYGDLNSFGEYISTGAKYTFTSAERALLAAGTDVSVDLDVWGGDCFISYHSFKISDSTYSIVNQHKHNAVALTLNTQVQKWGVYFDSASAASNPLSLPVAVKSSAQFIQVCIESEYNGDARDVDTIPMTTAFDVPRYMSSNESDAKVPLSYRYNTNISRGNTAKIYVPKPQFSFEQNIFPARILYSDLKIYNSDIAGFDIFRVGNAFDLEESQYGITKLAIGGDQLYAIQEQGILYIPTGERQIEQTDGGGLSVRSGDVIGRPLVIDAKRGSTHLKGIVETGGVIYIPDSRNKAIYAITEGLVSTADKTLNSITKDNDAIFRSIFASTVADKDIVGFYDPVKRQYWFVDQATSLAQIFNEAIGAWIGAHEFESLKAGVFTNNSLYLMGANEVATMYTGDVGVLFDEIVTPRVTFSINPDESFSKTFDNILVSASERLGTIDLSVKREASLTDQVIPTISLDSVSVEGNYRVKTVRDSDSARARGLRALATISWKEEVKSTLRAVWMKYRTSARTPF